MPQIQEGMRNRGVLMLSWVQRLVLGFLLPGNSLFVLWVNVPRAVRFAGLGACWRMDCSDHAVMCTGPYVGCAESKSEPYRLAHYCGLGNTSQEH